MSNEYDEEDLNLEIHDAWVKEKEDDEFRDTYEWLLAWDYFKAGWIAALNSQAKKNEQPE